VSTSKRDRDRAKVDELIAKYSRLSTDELRQALVKRAPYLYKEAETAIRHVLESREKDAADEDGGDVLPNDSLERSRER
jgi:hypothetical protein